jgi:carbon-monoxide dehydrogenase medium subunit
MNAAQSEYHRPSTVERACGLLADATRPAVVAGAQSLTLSIEDGTSRPDVFVDITDIESIDEIQQRDGVLSLGATVTHNKIKKSRTVSATMPALSTAASEIGDQQIRNAGTIGGTTAFRYHTADYPPVLIASDARILSQNENGQRERSAVDYFIDPIANQLDPDELITEIRVPVPKAHQGLAYAAFSYPGHTRGLVNVAASLSIVDEKCRDATLVIGSVDDNPQMIRDVTDSLIGSTLSRKKLSDVANHAGESASVTRCQEVSPDYLRKVITEMTEQAMQTAWNRLEDSHE